MSGAEAQRLVDSLLAAEQREVPTHGLLRVPWYLAALADGSVRPAGRLRVEQMSPVVAIIDGEGSYGYLPTWRATEIASDMSREFGVGVVGVRDIAEFGRAGYYTELAARRGAVAVVCQNTIPLIAAPGSDSAVYGNNPLSFSAPGPTAPVFDGAFTPRSGGELRRRALLGERIPLSWGYRDEHGDATTDPARAMAVAQQAVGGAKGFGMAMLVDLLAGIMTSSASGPHVPAGAPAVGAMVIAMDPGRFGVDEDAMAAAFAAAAGAVHAGGGRWPGDRARTALEASLRRGTIRVPEPIYLAVREVIGVSMDRCVRG